MGVGRFQTAKLTSGRAVALCCGVHQWCYAGMYSRPRPGKFALGELLLKCTYLSDTAVTHNAAGAVYTHSQ